MLAWSCIRTYSWAVNSTYRIACSQCKYLVPKFKTQANHNYWINIFSFYIAHYILCTSLQASSKRSFYNHPSRPSPICLSCLQMPHPLTMLELRQTFSFFPLLYLSFQSVVTDTTRSTECHATSYISTNTQTIAPSISSMFFQFQSLSFHAFFTATFCFCLIVRTGLRQDFQCWHLKQTSGLKLEQLKLAWHLFKMLSIKTPLDPVFHTIIQKWIRVSFIIPLASIPHAYSQLKLTRLSLW